MPKKKINKSEDKLIFNISKILDVKKDVLLKNDDFSNYKTLIFLYVNDCTSYVKKEMEIN